MSKLPPTVGGLNVPWPKLFNSANVAPVVPLLSSNTTPAQKMLGRTNCPGASGTDVSRLTPWTKDVGGKDRDNSGGPGNLPLPSAAKNWTRARAVTAVGFWFATEKVNWVTDWPTNAASG